MQFEGLYDKNIDFSPRTIRITPRMDSEQEQGYIPLLFFCAKNAPFTRGI